ncbi:TadE family protein [Pseudomonas sp. LFM046]|uniref:TadE/TadG family type IV pilus assembly protein n=1 Tax=Pseudomonas sp. LFM046 TaxID=1608357 RepID=UPI0005CFC2A3|nr:TadE family protein [Pseudomonas sp. LFM046]
MGRLEFRRTQAERGAAMVEFAITLPFLLLLMLAIGEIGRMLFQYNTLLQANRDAVRYVAGKAWNPTLGTVDLSLQLQAETKNLAVYGLPVVPSGGQPLVPGLTTGDVQIVAVGLNQIRVTTSYTFVPIVGTGIPALLSSAIPLNFPLVATTIMRVL